MNLIPYPKLHFLTSSIAPINLAENKTNNKTQMEIFRSILQDKNQFVKGSFSQGIYLSYGLFLRGQITISEVNSHIESIKKKVKMIWWN